MMSRKRLQPSWPLTSLVWHRYLHLWISAKPPLGGGEVALVNNAGIMPLSMIKSEKVSEWDQMIDVNIKGV